MDDATEQYTLSGSRTSKSTLVTFKCPLLKRGARDDANTYLGGHTVSRTGGTKHFTAFKVRTSQMRAVPSSEPEARVCPGPSNPTATTYAHNVALASRRARGIRAHADTPASCDR